MNRLIAPILLFAYHDSSRSSSSHFPVHCSSYPRPHHHGTDSTSRPCFPSLESPGFVFLTSALPFLFEVHTRVTNHTDLSQYVDVCLAKSLIYRRSQAKFYPAAPTKPVVVRLVGVSNKTQGDRQGQSTYISECVPCSDHMLLCRPCSIFPCIMRAGGSLLMRSTSTSSTGNAWLVCLDQAYLSLTSCFPLLQQSLSLLSLLQFWVDKLSGPVFTALRGNCFPILTIHAEWNTL